jgi:predicted N-formylglutamate amidohydrolase
MPYLLVEIRQDLIDTEAGARVWAERLGDAIGAVLAHPSLDRFAEPAPDVREPGFE